MTTEKKNLGFRAMSPETQREIARKGGKASHELGTGHEWNAKTASEAGKKGGMISAQRRAERKAAAATAGTVNVNVAKAANDAN